MAYLLGLRFFVFSLCEDKTKYKYDLITHTHTHMQNRCFVVIFFSYSIFVFPVFCVSYEKTKKRCLAPITICATVRSSIQQSLLLYRQYLVHPSNPGLDLGLHEPLQLLTQQVLHRHLVCLHLLEVFQQPVCTNNNNYNQKSM